MTDSTPTRRKLVQTYITELTPSVTSEVDPWKTGKFHVKLKPNYPMMYREGTPILSGWVSFVVCDWYMGKFIEDSYEHDGKLDIGLVSSNINLDMLAMTREHNLDCEVTLLERQGTVFKTEITVYDRRKKAIAHAVGTYHIFRV